MAVQTTHAEPTRATVREAIRAARRGEEEEIEAALAEMIERLKRKVGYKEAR